MQFELLLDSNFATFVSLNTDDQLFIKQENFIYNDAKSSVKLSWNTNGNTKQLNESDDIMSLMIKTKQPCDVHQIFKLGHKFFNSELYDESFEKLDLELQFSEINRAENESRLFMSQNYPNPIVENTMIEITSEDNVEGKILVTNMLGQKVYTKSFSLERGVNMLELKSSDFITEKIMF